MSGLKITIGLLVSVVSGSFMASAMAVEFSMNGDIRTGFYSAHRDTRSGDEDTTDEFRLRLRAGVTADLNEAWSARIRFAGRYSTDDRNHPHFEIFDSAPSGDGLRRGDSTLDEIFVAYRPNKQWQVVAGRFQNKFELDGVAKKSLDRVTSPNVDITWTDGVQVKHKAANGWVTTFIAQHNDEEGATEVRRGPLDFSDSGSRVSYFLSMENKQQHFGGIVQRTLDVSYLPDALHTDGVGAGNIDDYVVVVGRLAAKWPVTKNMKFMLAGALGYALNTPTQAAVKTGTSGDAGGGAGQLTFNLIDIVPAHSAALVVGRAEDGYLLSPDFRNNNDLVEARYKWKIAKNQSFTARLRKRTEIERQVGAAERQKDVDYYLRYTYKF